MRAWVGSIVAVALAAAVSAQDAEQGWAAAMSEGVAAYRADDLDAARSAFEQAIIRAETPLEEADALRALGIVRLEQGRTSDTLERTGRALGRLEKLAEAGDEAADALSKDLLDLRAETFTRLGREEEAYDALVASARFYARLPQPGWRVEQSGEVRHILSGFACPATVEGLPRTRFTTYAASGLDVGCSYGLGAGVTGAATLYFTKRDGGSLEASVDAMREEIDSVYGSPRVAENDELTRPDGAPVRRVIYERGGTRLPSEYSGGWLTDMSGWTAKVRISWSEPLERDFVERLADELSMQSTRGVFVGECAPMTARAAESDDPVKAVFAAMGVGEIVQEVVTGGRSMLGEVVETADGTVVSLSSDALR